MYHQSRRSGYRARQFDPSHLVRQATGAVPLAYVVKHQFEDFALLDHIKHNIASRRYTVPTAIQDQAIPDILLGRDVVGTANTGTGKTGAFLIPVIHRVVTDPTRKVLVVVPTRELAIQIQSELHLFARNLPVASVLCIGGEGMGKQIAGLKRQPAFVIGTPGRLRDLETQKWLSFHGFNIIVLDEVDRMMDMGFLPEVKYITACLPKVRQSLFFSATMPAKVQEMMRGFLTNPILVAVKSHDVPVNVNQEVIRVGGQEKIAVLQNLLRREGLDKGLVFGRTKWGMDKLAKALSARGLAVAVIHGNKNQNQRRRAIEQFKTNRVKVLIATDVASRGLDIDSVTHVINFDLPESYEDYVHRIGRTGRVDKTGTAITLVA